MRISHDAPPTGIPAAAIALSIARHDLGGAAEAGRAPLDYAETLDLLRNGDHPETAPHVAAHLCRRLRGDAAAMIETARLLSAAQLHGDAALPDPLPLVPAVVAVWGDSIAALDEQSRDALLIACVSVSHRTDTLLRASGLAVSDLVAEPLSTFLELVSGHFVVRDPRIRCVMHETATLGERTRAHARLADALRHAGRPGLAAWHSALATLEGDAGLVPQLLELSRAALRRGDSIWAFHVAREATSQAEGADVPRADLAAGTAALLSGYLDDAVYSLGRVIRCTDPALVRRALAPYAVAVTLSTGYVPDAEIAAHEAALDRDSAGDVGRSDIVAALAVAAALHAERGNDEAALDSLARGERLAGGGSPHGHLAVARSWCSAYGIDGVSPEDSVHPLTIEPRWLGGYLVASQSILLARTGAVALAESTISATRLRLSRDTARAVDGGPDYAATPLLEAHLGCAAALVAIAAGRYSTANGMLETAAFAGPVSLVFAGLAVAAAGRMHVLTTGIAGSEAPSGAPVPVALRRAALIDRAFAHAFAGRPGESAPLAGLADELPCSRLELMLPEPDECVLWSDAGLTRSAEAARRGLVARGRVSPEGAGWLASLRAALALASPHEVGRLREPAAETCRGVASVYDRAQTELVLSRALARASDAENARTHAVTAIELFFQTGAGALVAHARDTLSASLRGGHDDSSHDDSSHDKRNPDNHSPADHNLVERGHVERGSGHAAPGNWAGDLTDREREVAALVVLGRSNRDVARELHLSVRTIEVHLARVFTKLDVHSRTELSYLVHGGSLGGGRA